MTPYAQRPCLSRARVWWCALCCLGMVSGSALAEEWLYTTRPGDSLWNISKTYLQSVNYWARLQRHNDLKNPIHLPPGLQLHIPYAWLKVQPQAAVVVEVAGEVTLLTTPGAAPLPLLVGAEIRTGAELRTGNGGSATLRLADGSTFLLHGDSIVIFDTLSVYGSTGMADTRLRLQRGRLDNRVTPLKVPGSRYEITTPSAIAAVRGTEFRINATTDGTATRTEVLEHQVEVSAAGVSRGVPADYGTVAENGQPPSVPQALLPAPDLSAMPPLIRATRVHLQWPSLAEAAGYRVEIAPDDGFSSLLGDAVTREASLDLEDLPMGALFVRVRAIAANGLEGQNAKHRIEHHPPLAMPTLLQPPADTPVAHDGGYVYAWAAVPDAAGYRLQIARNAEFTETVRDERVKATKSVPAPALDSGVWYWRVAAYDDYGSLGDISLPRRLEVREPPAAPAALKVVLAETVLHAEWQAVSHAQRYQVDVARDEAFKDLVQKSEVASTRFETPPLADGHYWLRVRAIDDLGTTGSNSEAARVDVATDTPWWPLMFIFLVPWL